MSDCFPQQLALISSHSNLTFYLLSCFRKLEKQKEKKRKEEQKRKIASLSFNPEEGEEEDEEKIGEDEDCKSFQFYGV